MDLQKLCHLGMWLMSRFRNVIDRGSSRNDPHILEYGLENTFKNMYRLQIRKYR